MPKMWHEGVLQQKEHLMAGIEVASELSTQKLTKVPENAYSCSSLAMRLLASMPSRRQVVGGKLVVVLRVRSILSSYGGD